MPKPQKRLLIWSSALMLIAFALQRVGMGQRAAIAVGVIEVLLAIGTGIAFGLEVSKQRPVD
ncbi:MAG TPA: hypothetical protein VG778_08880 [Blastocatellia bacterium]|nr:hypothetical protein [Blastocatellia bacterium]